MNIQKLLFAVSVIVLSLLCSTRAAVALPTVSISPVSQTVNVPSQFSVDIIVNDVVNLHAAHIVVTYDNSVILCVNKSEGPFLKSGGQPTIFLPSAGANTVTTDIAILGPGTVSGSGVLTTLTFAASGAGASPLTLSAVDLRDGNNASIGVTLVSGQATCVDTSATTTAISSSVNPSIFGDAVSFTATVSATAGVPTGAVRFKIDNADYDVAVPLNSGSATSRSISTLAAGTHTVTAVYGGDGNHAPSTGTMNQAVSRAATTTAVATSRSQAAYGEAITFTATVAPGSTFLGTVQFRIDGADFGLPVPLSGNSATSGSITDLSAASHTVSALYIGDDNHFGSTGIYAQVVDRAGTTTEILSSRSPAVYGESLAFTASVGSDGSIDGTVQFRIDGVDVGLAKPLNGGRATSDSISTLTAGSHTVEVLYNGDDNHLASAGACTQLVQQAGTTTSVISSRSPATLGDSLTFIATIASGRSTAGGTVQFKIDGTDLGAVVAVTGGSARSMTAGGLAAGVHAVSALYSGDVNHSASTGTFDQVITMGTILPVLASSKNPSVFGDTVTFTATFAPGGMLPTGIVQFKIDGLEFGATVSLSAGSATSTGASSLIAGLHTVTAVYSGDANFSPATSTITQDVGQAGTSITITSCKSPSIVGDSLQFRATVSTRGTLPTGAIQFRIDNTDFGEPVALSSGSARSGIISTLPSGNHEVMAVYSGDTNHVASIGKITQVVNEKGPTGVDPSMRSPLSFVLHENYPNPFNPTTTIRYELPVASTVTVEVFNIRGEKIVTLVNEMQSAGSYAVQWNGMNGERQPVASGAYLCRVHAGKFLRVKKMVMMK